MAWMAPRLQAGTNGKAASGDWLVACLAFGDGCPQAHNQFGEVRHPGPAFVVDGRPTPIHRGRDESTPL